MYEAHFGLQGRPFDTGIAHEVDVFRGTRQSTIIDKAKLALAASDSVVTFCGPPGIGKTTLALAAVRSISTRIALAWLSSMPTNANEMLELLLLELGINAHRASRIERLQMWRQYLEEMSATDTRVFVIAERTEEFAPEVLRALDALTGTDASGSTGANVVLLGHLGLDGFLGTPSLESLRQRVRLRQRLEPFSSAELTEYLRHRVTQVGGNFDQLFAPGAAAAVYRVTGGVARLANTLCEAALTAAATTKMPALTPELFTQVAADILGVEEVTAPVTRATQVAPTANPAPAVAVPKTNAVTIASVAIDITPMKAAAVVAAPKTASAAPPASNLAVTPVSVPTSSPPAAVIAAAPKAAVAAPRPVAPAPAAPAPAPVLAEPVAPIAQSVAPTVPVQTPVAASLAPAPIAAAPAPTPAAVRPAPLAMPAPAPTPPSLATPPQTVAVTKPAAPRLPLPDFDATATDIPDISTLDFPVLTDAVEEFVPRARATPPSAPVPPAPVAKTIATPPAATRAPVPQAPHAATPPPSPAAAAAPSQTPFRRLLEPKAAFSSAPEPEPEPVAEIEEAPDQLRQTQTMRAISMAKSIDDVSDSMAETLFGEADLDFLSAALASSASENDESHAFAPESSASTPPAAESEDDLMDLFNLGPDAPLELIDDSASPPSDQRKSSARRGG